MILNNNKSNNKLLILSPSYSRQFLPTHETNNKSSNIYLHNEPLLLNFILKKHQYFIPKDFNEKNSKKFLDSKEVALRKIILDDELKLSQDIKSKPKEKEKKRVSKKKTYNCKMKSQQKKLTQKENTILEKLENNINNDKIYKCIIDNMNESGEIFDKKLKKEIDNIENQNKQKFFSGHVLTYKAPNTKYNKCKSKMLSPFNFSQTVKNRMSKDNIQVSSINNDNMSNTREKTQNKTVETIVTSGQKITHKKTHDKKDIPIDKKSDQESLLSLLSSFAK